MIQWQQWWNDDSPRFEAQDALGQLIVGFSVTYQFTPSLGFAKTISQTDLP